MSGTPVERWFVDIDMTVKSSSEPSDRFKISLRAEVCHMMRRGGHVALGPTTSSRGLATVGQ